MEVIIREIKVSDYLEVALLWVNVLEYRNVNFENFSSTMDKMNKDGNYKTFVALFSNKVVGFITTVQALAVGFEVGYLKIDGLAVHEEHQSKGIGTKLLKYVEDYSKEKGLSRIILCSGFKRTNAHTFYEHNGYDKVSYCFDKVL
jgi:GNAT superfamily N-acetyltransferase